MIELGDFLDTYPVPAGYLPEGLLRLNSMKYFFCLGEASRFLRKGRFKTLDRFLAYFIASWTQRKLFDPLLYPTLF